MGWFKALFGGKDKASPSTPVKDNKYQPLPKYYVFNETGNIMLCTTKADVDNLSEDFRAICAELSVFFAAMTKAISEVENPLTGKPYSIYNYQALKRVLNSSGMFIEVKSENMAFGSEYTGNSISKDLMQNILGREFGESRLSFAKGLFRVMGEQADPALQQSKKNNNDEIRNQAGSVFFVCESLLGMPLVSAVLLHLKAPEKGDKDHRDLHQIIDCQNPNPAGQRHTRKWRFSKRTYMFVPPKFFKNYLGDINDVDSHQLEAFKETLSDELRSYAAEQKQNLGKAPERNE